MADEQTQTHILILTPTARLARSVLRQQAAERLALGQASWQAPRVRSFSAWLAELRADWLLDGDPDSEVRIPIDSDQALMLWRSVIDPDIFIGEPRVAELAQRAWRTIHEQGLPAPAAWDAVWLSEDQRQFRLWCARFDAACRERGLSDEWTFAATLPDLIRSGRIAPPARVQLAGFELPMNALQLALIEALESVGCRVDPDRPEAPSAGPVDLFEYADDDEELRAAAAWARDLLGSQPEARIGIVVPDLGQRLARIERLFRQVFDPPGFALHGSSTRAWHVSLGHPLAHWPLCADALALLALKPWRISQPQAQRLLRSPFLAGWPDEARARSQAVGQLARRAPFWLTGAELMRQTSQTEAVLLGRNLAEWQQLRRQTQDRAWPSDWARLFQLELSSLGFGHGRTLDSREYQTLQRWHELMEAFSALDVVTEQPMTRAVALARLTERAGAAVFRERNPGAAVEILGVEEALGERFDALWVTSLHDSQWPPPARRDPLIPARLQAALPQATSDQALERSRLELAGLQRAAEKVIGSFARGPDEQARKATALLDTPAQRAAADRPAAESPAIERLDDDSQAPALEDQTSAGGTGVLQDQADCPFKAFAVWRLGASDTRPPRPGLDARDRGSLLHQSLEAFWRRLPDQAALLALSPEQLEQQIAAAADQALNQWQQRRRLALSAAGIKLERTCLVRAMQRWLDIERQRGPFRIEQLEQALELEFGPLKLSGKIDRIDRLPDGSTLLIDYKTGQASRNDWAPGGRLASVQMPAYAVNLHPPPQGLAFALLKPEKMGFNGLAGVASGIDSVETIGEISRQPYKDIASWDVLLDDWQTQLDALAEQFAGGRAEVDPRSPQVCRHCHLTALCRIRERSQIPEEDWADE